MIVDGFVMVVTISSTLYWFHIVTTMLIINLVTIFSKAIYAMLKLEDVRGLFSHEFFFSHPLCCCPWRPKPGRFSQWRLLAKALMTPRSKSMNYLLVFQKKTSHSEVPKESPWIPIRDLASSSGSSSSSSSSSSHTYIYINWWLHLTTYFTILIHSHFNDSILFGFFRSSGRSHGCAWHQAPGLPWTMPSSASWPASHGCPAQQFDAVLRWPLESHGLRPYHCWWLYLLGTFLRCQRWFLTINVFFWILVDITDVTDQWWLVDEFFFFLRNIYWEWW